VALVGIDHELRRHSQGPKRLVHLLAAADRKAFSIGNAASHQVVDTGEQVLDLFVAPIGEYGLRERGAATNDSNRLAASM
jgi:hypothetical protein